MAALAVLIPVFPAMAESGLYGAIRGGAALFKDQNFSGQIVEFDSNFDTGFALSGAVGYDFEGALRAEAEVSHRSFDIRGTFADHTQAFVPCGEFPGNPCLDPNTRGDTAGLSFMVNVYADFAPDSSWNPYLGVGVGVTRINLDLGVLARHNDGDSGRFAIIDDNHTTFAYQGAAGLGYRLSESITLTLGYRYFRTLDFKLAARTNFNTVKYKLAFESHNIEGGVRFRF